MGRRSYVGPFVDEREKFFALIFEQLPETVVDKESLRQLQIDDLFAAMNHTRTAAGAATLYRSLLQPLSSLDLILAKQESLRELEGNDRLRNAVADYLEEMRQLEQALLKFLNERIRPTRPIFDTNVYREFKEAAKASRRLTNAAKQIPNPDSAYLESLITLLQGFSGVNAFRLTQGPVYKTFNGMKSKGEIGLFTPRLKFKPNYLSGFGPKALAGLTILNRGLPLDRYQLDNFLTSLTMGSVMSLWAVSAMYMCLLKTAAEKDWFIDPLARQLRADPEFQFVFDSLGKLY